MTVITMPSSEKKSDNVPLVTDIEVDPSTAQAKDLEAGNVENDRSVRSKFLVLRVINDRVYSMWALVYVILMSIFITLMLVYGESIYKTIGNAFNDETDTFYGTETITLNDKLTFPLEDNYNLDQLSEMEFKSLESFASNMEKLNSPLNSPERVFTEFKEEFEIGLKDENYEKIVPILPLGSSARFIHDFSANVTGIIDIEGQRCFVMPLNRSSVLPPKSLYDLLFKMSSGYYAVDTSNLLHNMRIVEPAIKDLSEYGIYIAKECSSYPTYKLENIVSGVFKRSAPSDSKTFSVFSGRMNSFRIANYHEVDPQ